MEEILKSSLAAIGGVILAGGGLAALAYGLFRYLGEKWLSAKFDERLAAYKHAQQRELEGLKFEISKLMDRTVKLHQREFEVLPEAWGRLVEAHSVVAAFVSAMQSYANVDRMNPAHLDEFLEKSPLMSWQKAELKDSTRKTDYYIKAIFWHQLAKASAALRESHVYLKKNGIFVHESIKSKFVELDGIIFDALTEHEINMEPDMMPKDRTKAKELGTKGAALLAAIEKDVQGRLWSAQESKL